MTEEWENAIAGMCENEIEVRQFIGYEMECIDCDELITTRGQTICYGNIKFLDYCPKHIKTCMNCNNSPCKMKSSGTTADLVFICNECFLKINMNQITMNLEQNQD